MMFKKILLVVISKSIIASPCVNNDVLVQRRFIWLLVYIYIYWRMSISDSEGVEARQIGRWNLQRTRVRAWEINKDFLNVNSLGNWLVVLNFHKYIWYLYVLLFTIGKSKKEASFLFWERFAGFCMGLGSFLEGAWLTNAIHYLRAYLKRYQRKVLYIVIYFLIYLC